MHARAMFAAICIFCAVAAASAQQYPGKTVRMLVGFAPGGGTDVVARVIGQKLVEAWGQQFVVENRAGATGTIAADIVAKSAPDGYTLIMGHVNSHGIAPSVFRKLPYDPSKDFAMVAYVGYVPNVLVVHPSIPARSVKELVALAKQRPGQLSFASSGVGSTQHLAGEMFMLATATRLVHIPYKGSGQAIVDLLAGHVAMNFDTMPPILSSVRADRLRALAVTTPKRVPQLADTPTMLELGFTGYEMTNWYGVMAPATTPRDIVVKLNAEINRIMTSADAKGRLEDVGTQLDPMSPEQFADFLRKEIAKYAKVVKDSNVRID